MNTRPVTFGEHLRLWRRRRQLSQEALADRANLSTRHLSFLETGRANPSREMVVRLAERLEVPLRERNPMLQAAGYAPRYRNTPLAAPEMEAARRSLELVLERHLPNPCLAFDRHYSLVAANAAAGALMQGAASELLTPPVNVLRLSLHPLGVAPRIVNFAQWRHHLLERLRRECAATGDPVLAALRDEVIAYPLPPRGPDDHEAEATPSGLAEVLLPLRLRTDDAVLSFISIVTVFGTPHDITLQELAIETFLPADAGTEAALARFSRTKPASA
jgi:transcriptional regulator with XRE-family HTH domain